MLEKKNDALIAAKAVLARYGGICGMTLHVGSATQISTFPSGS
jgi:hypothetical protein